MADDNSMFDKMVEMGMGMAIASQIPQMMNSVMPNVASNNQQAPPPINSAGSMKFYAIINNNQAGPFNEQEFITLVKNNMVNANTFVWKPGMKNWLPAQQVPEAGKLLLLYGNK